VGEWPATVASVTPDRSVWTTLQVCASGSSDPDGSGAFVIPTRHQERFMIYDEIINGARNLAFYGGNLPPAAGTRRPRPTLELDVLERGARGPDRGDQREEPARPGSRRSGVDECARGERRDDA
jgi:hypothetical protein